MKKIIFVIALLSLLTNAVSCIILPYYSVINCVLSSFAIISTAGLLLYLVSTKNGVAYKISLTFIFLALGITKFLFAVLSLPVIIGNYSILVIFGIIIFEVLTLLLTQLFSKHI
ncbi:MAG: hypothetical protein WCK02_14630 [Bacteroidota bacterium]